MYGDNVPVQLGGISDVLGPVLAGPGDGAHKGGRGVTAGSCLHIQFPIWEHLHMVHRQLQHRYTFMSCHAVCTPRLVACAVAGLSTLEVRQIRQLAASLCWLWRLPELS